MARGDLLLATNAGFHVGFCTSNFSDPVGGTLLKKSLQSRYVAAYVATRQGNHRVRVRVRVRVRLGLGSEG